MRIARFRPWRGGRATGPGRRLGTVHREVPGTQPLSETEGAGAAVRAPSVGGCPCNAHLGTLSRPHRTGSPLGSASAVVRPPAVLGVEHRRLADHPPRRVQPHHRPEGRREADVPAQQPSPSPQARVPRSHADQVRSADHQQPPQPRPVEAVGMIPVVPPHGTLRHGRDIARTLRSSNQRAGHLLVAHGRQRGDQDQPRIAVIASRRVGGAVPRNRAKRLLREAARHLPLRPGTDLVLVARGACSTSDLRSVHAELEVLVTSLGLAATPAEIET